MVWSLFVMCLFRVLLPCKCLFVYKITNANEFESVNSVSVRHELAEYIHCKISICRENFSTGYENKGLSKPPLPNETITLRTSSSLWPKKFYEPNYFTVGMYAYTYSEFSTYAKTFLSLSSHTIRMHAN